MDTYNAFMSHVRAVQYIVGTVQYLFQTHLLVLFSLWVRIGDDLLGEPCVGERNATVFGFINTLIKEQTRTKSLSSKLSDSQEEAETLKKQLADLRHEAEQDHAAAVLELEKLGAVAVSEINKLGQITKELHAQKRNQASLIMIIEKRLQEQALKSKHIGLAVSMVPSVH